MTKKAPAGLSLTLASARRPNLHRQRSSVLAAAMVVSLCALGAAGPAIGQDANRLALCSLDADTIEALQGDVADATSGNVENVEVAFVVVYSLSHDNNGQPLAVGTTGPVLCTNPAVGAEATAQTDVIGTVDILDASEALVLRYEASEGTGPAETRFCHTTNENVDCYVLIPD